MFVKEPQLFYGQVLDVFGLTHFLFHYLPYDFESRDEITFRGKDCNTPGVSNTKTCHVIICIVHHLVLVKILICIHYNKFIFMLYVLIGRV